MLVNGIEANVRVRLIKGYNLLESFESYNSRGELIISIDASTKRGCVDKPEDVNRFNIYERLYGESIETFDKHLRTFGVKAINIMKSMSEAAKNILEIRERYKSDDISITVPIELESIKLIEDVLEVSVECIDNQVDSMTFNLRSRRNILHKEVITHIDIEYGLNFDSLNKKLYEAVGYSLTSPDIVIISNILNNSPKYELNNVSENADVSLIFKYNLEIEREEFNIKKEEEKNGIHMTSYQLK